MNENINELHCCERMQFFLNERKVAIGYYPRCREYYIRLYTSGGVQLINYCPWCGCRLPTSLNELYCETLEELGYDEPFSNNIPEKYKTDEWWQELEGGQ